jgi:hypothetical protein
MWALMGEVFDSFRGRTSAFRTAARATTRWAAAFTHATASARTTAALYNAIGEGGAYGAHHRRRRGGAAAASGGAAAAGSAPTRAAYSPRGASITDASHPQAEFAHCKYSNDCCDCCGGGDDVLSGLVPCAHCNTCAHAVCAGFPDLPEDTHWLCEPCAVDLAVRAGRLGRPAPAALPRR